MEFLLGNHLNNKSIRPTMRDAIRVNFIIDQPASVVLTDIIEYNKKMENFNAFMEIELQLLNGPVAVENFKDDESTWYKNTPENRTRCEIMKWFSKFTLQQHYELLNRKRFKSILPLKLVKKYCKKHEFRNYSMIEKQDDLLLSLQGYIIHNFLHLYLLSDLAFFDKIDSLNIEYNNPYSREKIRQ